MNSKREKLSGIASTPAARVLPRCIAILGPTCSWKSEVGVLVAEAVGGEVISCDSMQVYRGLDIGTAKPTRETRARVRHHLVDILDIHSPYSAGAFAEQAEEILAGLQQREKVGVLVGGTGLYARAFVYGFKNRPSDWRIARDVWSQFATPAGPEQLRAELAAADPGNAALSAPNPRRLMRAVGMLRITGKAPIAEPSDRPDTPKPGFAQWIVLPTMEVLRQRIADRTRAMLAAGWIEETERLVKAGLLDSPTARQALGYRDIAAYLNDASPERNREDLVTTLFHRTVAYARRQRTWFRHQHQGSRTIEVNDASTTSRDLAATILGQLRSFPDSPA